LAKGEWIMLAALPVFAFLIWFAWKRDKALRKLLYGK
jgi:hypothetical protein